MSTMIIRINGLNINSRKSTLEPPINTVAVWKPTSEKMKVACVNTWIVASTLITTSKSYAASSALSSAPSIWSEMLPVFHVFQDISMVLGALAILSGLIIMIFKKSLGWTVVNTSIAVVLGCFLVPAAVMLLAIVGDLLNGSLQHAFEAFHSVKR